VQPRKIIFLLFGFFLLVFIYRWGWYNDIARSVLRYQETGLNSHFSYPASQPFSAYINTTEMMVKNARRQGGVDDSKQTVLENSPHRLLPHSAICKKESNGKYKKGILFIHGFLDSPYSFRALANFFQDKCFVVYQVLLPGHGTVPGDLLTVQYQDWTAAVDYAILQLSREVNNIYLTGFSLGGLLATNVAVQRPNTFKALILLSPLFKFKFKFPAAIPLVNSLSHWIPRLRWLNYADDSVQVRYISYPVNAVYQIKKLLDRVNKKLAINKISLPLFIMQSAEDQTVDAD
jgi:esterase/lipase